MKKLSRIWSIASTVSYFAALVLFVLLTRAFGDVIQGLKSIEDLLICVKVYLIFLFLLSVTGTFCVTKNSGITLEKHPTAKIVVLITSIIELIISYSQIKQFALETYGYFEVYLNDLHSPNYYALLIILCCLFCGMLFGFAVSVLTNKTEDDSPNPSKPEISDKIFAYCFFAFFAFVTFICSNRLSALGVSVSSLITGLFLIVYPIAKWRYDVNLWRNDPEKFWNEENARKQERDARKKSFNENMQAFDERIEAEKKRQHIDNKIPDCPNCGSYDVTRISTAIRTVSVMTVGLASGKIGKQYKCNKCKHIW